MIPMMVVPTLTRHDRLEQMLDTVDGGVEHLVVIDNSGRGVVLPDGPWEDVTIFVMPANIGVAASWNLALKMAYDRPYVLICSDDVLWPEGAMDKFEEKSGEDRLLVSSTWPHWCAFTIGMGVVSKVGSFEENYFPAYFEDKDYERRCADLGVTIDRGPEVDHFNSSTLHTPDRDFARTNKHSFHQNKAWFDKQMRADFDPMRWRDQAW